MVTCPCFNNIPVFSKVKVETFYAAIWGTRCLSQFRTKMVEFSSFYTTVKIEQLYTKIDGLNNELSATKLQLSSKCEAIKILSKRLEETKKEAEQFKLMAEQVR